MKKQSMGLIFGTKEEGTIVALDFDNCELEKVEDEVKRLQRQWQLGNAVISELSEDSYHVFFFWNKVSWEQYQEILNDSNLVDEKFKNFKQKFGFLRMRISKKAKKPVPKIAKFIESIFHKDTPEGEFYFHAYKNLIKEDE